MEGKLQTPKYIFNGWGAVALVGGMILGSAIISLLNAFCIFVLKINFQYENWYLILITASGFLGAIFCFDYYICRPQTGKKLNFSLASANLTTYLLIFPMMIGMMLIAEFLTAQIPTSGPLFGPLYETFSKMMEQMTRDKATLILLVVFMAPLFEEIIFRGIILKGFLNRGMGPKKAILFSSVIFGVIHGNPWQFLGATLLGLVLGLVYYKTKSLLLPILLHAFNNLISSVLILHYNTESFSETFKISGFHLFIGGLILFTGTYLLFSRSYRVHYRED